MSHLENGNGGFTTNGSSKPRLHLEVPMQSAPCLFNLPTIREGESIYSLLSRTALANGAPNLTRFLFDLGLFDSVRQTHLYSKMDLDLCHSAFRDFLKIDGRNDWMMSMTVNGITRMRDSQYMQATRLLGYASTNIKLTELGLSMHRINDVRVCPACLEEDKAQGGEYFRLIHQIPGIEVCPYHRVPLMQYYGLRGEEMSDLLGEFKRFKTLEPSPLAERYAAVCLAMYTLRPAICVQDLIVSMWSLSPREKWKLSSDMHHVLYCPEKRSAIKTEQLISGIAQSVDDVEGLLLRAVPDTSGLEDMFMESIKGRFSLASPFDISQVKAVCSECGFELDITPHAMIAGLGCPRCEATLNKYERNDRMLARSGLYEEWSIDKLPGVSNEYVHMKNHKTGAYHHMPLHALLFWKTMPPAIWESISDVRSRFDRSLSARREKMGDECEALVSKYADFTLLSVNEPDDRHHETWLTLKHEVCGRSFDIEASRFRISPYCRCCQGGGEGEAKRGKKKVYAERYIHQLVREMSGGKFEWCGFVDNKIWKYRATDGRRTICSWSLQTMLRRVVVVSKYGWKKRDLEPFHKDLDGQIELLRGRVFFNEDLQCGWEDEYNKKDYLSRLNSRGVLESLGEKIWCHNGEVHDPLDVIERKYGDRYGQRIGYPVCDSLLKELGIIDEVASPAYVLPGDSYRYCSKDTVMGVKVSKFFYGVTLLDTGIPTVQFMTTIRFKKSIAAWNNEVALALAVWAKRNGVTADSIWNYYEFSCCTNSVATECRRLLEKVE